MNQNQNRINIYIQSIKKYLEKKKAYI
jgi:hypothetical protein